MQYAPAIAFFLIILTPLLPALVHGMRCVYERYQALGRRSRSARAMAPSAAVRR